METTINNITIHYECKGEGRPLVLLHGNGEDHHIFDALIEKLQKDFTVYAIDSRNHGESSKTDDYGYEAMTEDLRLFIEDQELDNPHIVGFSDGAIVALMLELAQPNTFAGMMLLGLNLKPTDFIPENLAYLQEEFSKTGDKLLQLMLEQPQIELEELHHISIPTIIVAAEDDLFQPSLYTNIMTKIKGAQFIEMKGHDHASYVVNQDILYPMIIKEFETKK